MSELSIREQFEILKSKWIGNVGILSDPIKMSEDVNYQKIIGLGWPVVTYLIEDMSINFTHWFITLQKITGTNPIKSQHAGIIPLMVGDWIAWFYDYNKNDKTNHLFEIAKVFRFMNYPNTPNTDIWKTSTGFIKLSDSKLHTSWNEQAKIISKLRRQLKNTFHPYGDINPAMGEFDGNYMKALDDDNPIAGFTTIYNAILWLEKPSK